MCSTESGEQYLAEEDREALLEVAREAIRYGLDKHAPMPVNLSLYPDALKVTRASFVTLLKDNRLRGCIGHLEATQPVVRDVAENAFAAAFQDPRFAPLEAAELEQLEIHISLLTPAQPIDVESEHDLIAQLRPGVDGLILQEGYHRGTFLPSVWEQLPEPALFLRHLKMKAGLPGDYWSERLRVSRYTTESFPQA
ncbi:MAG: AmmeMemoRadiSam system protein A [Sedimenticola sp.]|nr:AmmeMemoRadiSam system protein A [Sedimenticola sp.]